MAVVSVRASSALLFSNNANILIWITKRANKMGIQSSHIYFDRPSVVPAENETPTFDPQYGFKKQRLPRVSQISEEEMRALKIPKKMRDYCAHYWKDYLVCHRQYTPFVGLCNPEYHAYEHCQIEDYILRMKEYEREKRLRMRAARKEQAVS